MPDLERSSFGLPMTPHAENPLFADPTPEEIAEAPVEEVVAEEAPAAVEETPADTEPEEEATEETQVAVEEPAAETEEVTETVEELIFGKYKDMEAAQNDGATCSPGTSLSWVGRGLRSRMVAWIVSSLNTLVLGKQDFRAIGL